MALRVLAYLLVPCCLCLGQEVTGNIFGTVTDQTGAAVPGAKVTVTNTDRDQVIRSLETNAEGQYTAPLLPLGRYEVAVEAQGFKRTAIKDISISASDRRTVNLSLEIGDLTQQVSVEAAAIQVELQSAQQQGLITGTMVRELALNNRHFAQLLTLQPGVSSGTSDSLSVGTINPTTGGANLVQFSVNGQRQSANNFTVDGADITDRGSNQTIINYPSIDAIEEVRVVRSAYSAEFGRSAGGQVNIITRSGTSNLHGSAYEFFRNDALNANNFFNNANKIARPPFRYNNFGYTVGGPVFIPKVWNTERNRTFFFWSQEWRRTIVYPTANALVPTAAERRGEFSRPVCVGPTTSPCSQTATRIESINPVAAAYIQDVWSKVPLPNGATNPNELFNVQRGVFNSRQELIRIDHTFHEKFSLAGRYLNDTIPTIEPGGLFTNGAIPGVHTTQTNSPGKTFVLRGTSTLSPRVYNEAGFTISKGGIYSQPIGLASSIVSPNVDANLPFESTQTRLPSLNYSGALSAVSSFGPYDNTSWNYSVFNNTSWVKGRHNLKFGGLWNLYRKRENAAGLNAGSFTFAVDPKPTGTTNPQQAWANFLLGNVATFSQSRTDVTADLKMHGFELYAHDDFRVTNRFTLNLGLRWSDFLQPVEANNLLSNFDPSAWDPAQAVQINPTTGNIIPGSGNPWNGLIFAEGNVPAGGKVSPYGRRVGSEDHWNFAPRFGFAWDVWGTGRTAVRGGYGMFYDTQLIGIYQQNIFTNPPSPTVTISNTRLDNPAAGTPVVSAAPIQVRGTPVDYKTPYSQQWSLDIQQEVMRDFVMTAGYVGSKGTNLIGIVDINQVAPGLAAQAGIATPTTYITTANTPRLNILRPYRGYSAINVIRPWFNSNYHSLQVSGVKRFSHGSTVNLAYTWSKNLTDNGSDRSNAPQSTYLRELDYGPAPLDRRHVFTVSYVYEIPWLRDRRDLLGTAFGGWQVSGITTYFTGTPLTVTMTGRDPMGGGILGPSASGARPDVLRDPLENWNPEDRLRYFDTAAFLLPPPGAVRPGNAGRGLMYGPDTHRWDVSLFKNFRFTEDVRLQFRAETFNVFNHTNFNNPVTNFNAGNFGRLTSTRDPRNMQLGLKFNF